MMRRALQVSLPLAWQQHQAAQRRGIIVPRQMKAYGDEFYNAKGDRSNHMLGHNVLMKLRSTKSIMKTTTTTAFKEMGLNAPVRDALQTLGVTVPSPTQQLAMTPAVARKDVVLAGPSGSGKTLAYLAPMFSNIIKDRDVYGIPVREGRPRAIVLSSSRELIKQVHKVCRVFDEEAGTRSVCITAQRRSNHKSAKLLKSSLADVHVMHPSRALKLIRSKRLFIEDLRYVVIDEADALLSKEHDDDAAKLLALVRKRNMNQHLWPVETSVFFSTTNITRNVRSYCERLYPSAINCVDRGSHLPPQQANIKFLKVGHTREKYDYLKYVLKMGGNHPKELLTDEDEADAMRWKPLPPLQQGAGSETSAPPMLEASPPAAPLLSDTATREQSQSAIVPQLSPMKQHWISAHRKAIVPHSVKWEFLRTLSAPYTGVHPQLVTREGKRTIIFFKNIDNCTALYNKLKRDGFDASIVHGSLPAEVRDKMMRQWAEGHTNILCTTDALSRGIDYHVDAVINFDMPTNAVAFLNRAGRTARMGRPGKVISIYTRKQRTIVAVIKALVKKNISLEHVSNWYRHMTKPSHSLWKKQKIDSVARKHVHLLMTKTIPGRLTKVYRRHNAMWRPLFRPKTVGEHGGIPVVKQQKVMDKVMFDAVWYRRGVLAKRKGGKAKFGATDKRGEHNWTSIEGARVAVAGTSNSHSPSHDAGTPVGPPQQPPS